MSKLPFLTRIATSTLLLLFSLAGCAKTPVWGIEQSTALPGHHGQIWAIAPAINLSGHREVDALLQSDLLYQQLQEVRGLTVVPVDRVIPVYVGLKLEQVQSPEQASIVCEALGCDALIVPTVTAYDPYDPPKFGVALQMFRKKGGAARIPTMDLRALARAAAPTPEQQTVAQEAGFVQAVGIFDATNGSVRDALFGYAKGRHDPVGPIGVREYLLSMDRYVGFVYHTLIIDLLRAESRGSVAKPT